MANSEDQRMYGTSDQIKVLREKIDKDCSNPPMGWKLVSVLQSLKALDKQESQVESNTSSECFTLQAQIHELEKLLHTNGNGSSESLNQSVRESNENLTAAKEELGAKLKAIVQLRWQLDEIPSQAELIQYELRSSQLYSQIQKKLRQTRKHYDTYNALMEIKELMLKETSLLNSISLQFQGAIASVDGRLKLIDSLDGILKGIQRKLEKVQLTLQAEQITCDSLQEKYRVSVTEQRHGSSLLKLFQEECAKNAKLRSQISQANQ